MRPKPDFNQSPENLYDSRLGNHHTKKQFIGRNQHYISHNIVLPPYDLESIYTKKSFVKEDPNLKLPLKPGQVQYDYQTKQYLYQQNEAAQLAGGRLQAGDQEEIRKSELANVGLRTIQPSKIQQAEPQFHLQNQQPIAYKAVSTQEQNIESNFYQQMDQHQNHYPYKLAEDYYQHEKQVDQSMGGNLPQHTVNYEESEQKTRNDLLRNYHDQSVPNGASYQEMMQAINDKSQSQNPTFQKYRPSDVLNGQSGPKPASVHKPALKFMHSSVSQPLIDQQLPPSNANEFYDPFYQNQQRFLNGQKQAMARQNQIYARHLNEISAVEQQRRNSEQQEDAIREERRRVMFRKAYDDEINTRNEIKTNQNQFLLGQISQHEMQKKQLLEEKRYQQMISQQKAQQMVQQDQQLRQMRVLQQADYRNILNEQKMESNFNKQTPMIKLNAQIFGARNVARDSTPQPQYSNYSFAQNSPAGANNLRDY